MNESTAQIAKNALMKNGDKDPKTFSGLNSHQIMNILELYRLQIANILPKGTSIDRYIQIATTMIANNPKIASCTISSVIGATLLAATLDFDPSPELGFCYFVPFFNGNINLYEVKFVIGYRGIVELAYRSDMISLIYAHVVYENDQFECNLGLHRDIKHVYNYRDPGNDIIAAYAVYFTKSNQFDFVVLSKKELLYAEKRAKSAAHSDSPWNQPDSKILMYKKTAVKKLLKFAPISPHDRRVITIDESSISLDTLQPNGVIDLSKANINQSEKNEFDASKDENHIQEEN